VRGWWVPPRGQERSRGESGREEIISRGTREDKAVVRRMGRRARGFIVGYGEGVGRLVKSMVICFF